MRPKSRWWLALGALSLLAAARTQAEPPKSIVLGGEFGQNGTLRAQIKFEAAGRLIVSQDGQAAAPLPLSLTAEQTYLERLLPGDEKLPLSVRLYDSATAKIQLGDRKRDLVLADDHRLIVVHDAGTRPFACPKEPLTSDEVELLDTPCASLALDRLLPLEAVELGQSWTHSDELAADLLGLDAVSASTLRSTLREIKGDVARIELAGAVHGAEQGVATEIEVKARYTSSVRGHRVTWMGMVLKEKRTAGTVTAGLEVTSRLTMTLAAADDVPELSEARMAEAVRRADVNQPLVYERPGQFSLTYDRSWHEIVERDRLLVLRCIDRGELIAQCNVADLEAAKPGEDSLAAFEADVRGVLGENLEQIVSANELPHHGGYRVHRVIAAGKSSELPIRWAYYRLRDGRGRQAAIVFTVEQQHLDRFAEADQKLVSGFRFAAPNAVAAQSGPTQTK